MRFSIRDLLWVTLVAAIGLGWWVREVHWRQVVEQAPNWRTAAGALESVLKDEGWTAQWSPGKVVLEKPPSIYAVSTTDIEPTTDEP
jgi:hypothetical protein